MMMRTRFTAINLNAVIQSSCGGGGGGVFYPNDQSINQSMNRLEEL